VRPLTSPSGREMVHVAYTLPLALPSGSTRLDSVLMVTSILSRATLSSTIWGIWLVQEDTRRGGGGGLAKSGAVGKEECVHFCFQYLGHIPYA
jgi:hypothetical protein